MKKLTYLLDLDGTLVDFINGAYREHGVEPRPSLKHADVVHYITQIKGCAEKDFYAPLEEGFWRYLDWMPDGKEIREVVREFGHPGESLFICSKPTRNLGCVSGKLQWLKREWPSMERNCIFIGKKELLAKPDVVLIDDREEAVDAFTAAGGQAVMVPRTWNRMGRTDAPAFIKHSLQRLTNQI